MPGSASMVGSSSCACSSVSASSAPIAISGPRSSVCNDVIAVSRPKTVMNHGIPAAKSGRRNWPVRIRKAARSPIERSNERRRLSQSSAHARDAQRPGGDDVASRSRAPRRARRVSRTSSSSHGKDVDADLPALVRARARARTSSRSRRAGPASRRRAACPRSPRGSTMETWRRDSSCVVGAGAAAASARGRGHRGRSRGASRR